MNLELWKFHFLNVTIKKKNFFHDIQILYVLCVCIYVWVFTRMCVYILFFFNWVKQL